MRRSHYLKAPKCSHHQAIWAAHDQDVARHRELHPYDYAGIPKSPEDAEGYCEDCRRALYQPGAVWPAEGWAFLDAEAAATYDPCKPLKPYKLPGAPKVRREAPDALYARVRAAYSLPEKARDRDRATAAKVEAVIGARCGEQDGQPWYIETTNVHCALIRPGAGTKDRTIRLVGGYGAEWIDLPADLYLALQRIRLFANQRSEGVTLSIDQGQVKLSARSCELGEASETILPVLESDQLTEYETCLNAEYLDACLGSWPLRWYLRPPVEHDRPAGRYERGDAEGRVHWTEQLPQIFQPAGAEWRAAIMPMGV